MRVTIADFVAVLGLCIYLLCNRQTPLGAKIAEVGRIMFAFGLLVVLLEYVRVALRF